jgi:hypothetical protein
LICRLRVLLSGASIDGSLWYGDLPAIDGARDDGHSRIVLLESTKAPSTPRKPTLVERCCTS